MSWNVTFSREFLLTEVSRLKESLLSILSKAFICREDEDIRVLKPCPLSVFFEKAFCCR